jgi:hypothetical protein
MAWPKKTSDVGEGVPPWLIKAWARIDETTGTPSSMSEADQNRIVKGLLAALELDHCPQPVVSCDQNREIRVEFIGSFLVSWFSIDVHYHAKVRELSRPVASYPTIAGLIQAIRQAVRSVYPNFYQLVDTTDMT